MEFETVSLGLLARTHLKVVKPSLNLKLIPRKAAATNEDSSSEPSFELVKSPSRHKLLLL